MNIKPRRAFVMVLFSLFISLFFISEQSARAELWRYRDARGGVHFVNDRSLIPQRFRHTATPVEPKNENPYKSRGGVRVVPGAALGAVPTHTTKPMALKPAPPTPPPVHAPATVESETLEGDEGRAMVREQIKTIQAINPFADAQVSDQGSSPLALVSKFMSNPRTVKLGQALGSAQVIAALENMMANPNKLYGLIAVAVLLFFIGFFKWRLTRSRHIGFMKGLFLKLILAIVFIFGSVMISYVVYGEPLVVVFHAVKKGLEL